MNIDIELLNVKGEAIVGTQKMEVNLDFRCETRRRYFGREKHRQVGESESFDGVPWKKKEKKMRKIFPPTNIHPSIHCSSSARYLNPRENWPLTRNTVVIFYKANRLN